MKTLTQAEVRQRFRAVIKRRIAVKRAASWEPAAETPRGNRAAAYIRLAAWILLPLLGLAQAWVTRHRVFSDGVSYLEIASFYARGEWQNALNEYWSPLISMLMAVIFKVFSPPPYWEAAVMHGVIFAAFLVSLAFFELFLGALLRLQRRRAETAGRHLSESTLRIAGYSMLLWAGLHLIGIGYNSPDMLGVAVIMLASYLLLRVEERSAGTGVFIGLGITLGFGFLARAALLPIAAIYMVIAATLAWRRQRRLVAPVAGMALAFAAIAGPFVVALSVAKGRFTTGETAKLNYAWEVRGATRTSHWQGEPYDIGVPLHPTRKVLDHPAVYEFGAPLPGTYPPWFEPSYWHAGISPGFKLGPQMAVLWKHLRLFTYLFLISPAVIGLALIPAMGMRRGLARLADYWFLLVPVVAYMGLFCLVWLDKRYIGGSLVVVWMCILASVAVPRSWLSISNIATQLSAALLAAVLIGARLADPVAIAATDLVNRAETERNVEWLLAERFRDAGVRPGDRIAYLGRAIDADWARMIGARIVVEAPVIWEREELLNRRIFINYREVDAYWNGTPEERERVHEAFRKAGAVIAVADTPPPRAFSEGWRRVLPADTPGLPAKEEHGQWNHANPTAYMKLY